MARFRTFAAVILLVALAATPLHAAETSSPADLVAEVVDAVADALESILDAVTLDDDPPHDEFGPELIPGG